MPLGGSLVESDGVLVSRGIPVLRPGATSSGRRGVFLRRKDHEAAGLVYSPQFSENLTTWQDSAAQHTVLAEDGEMEVVSVPWPATPASGKLFFRVGVTLP